MEQHLNPKEKAQDLVNKMTIQYALIMTNEILNDFGTLTEGKQHYAADCTIKYYEKVKEEIINIQQQTAVEWLEELIECGADLEMVKNAIPKAKQMEKKQIMNAYIKNLPIESYNSSSKS